MLQYKYKLIKTNMSLLNFLQFQPIDSNDDSEVSPEHRMSEKLDLKENIDESELDAFWDEVEKDIHNDPEWFNFSD